MSFAPAPSLDAPRMFDQPSDTPPIASKKPVVLQWARARWITTSEIGGFSRDRLKGAADVLLAGMLIVFTLRSRPSSVWRSRSTAQGRSLPKTCGWAVTVGAIRYSRLERRDARSAPRSNWIGREQPTRVGHFLQYSRIEELPKLLNVLRGEMTLIGAPGKPHAFDD